MGYQYATIPGFGLEFTDNACSLDDGPRHGLPLHPLHHHGMHAFSRVAF